MRRHLLRRLAKLEQRYPQREKPPLLVLLPSLSLERRQQLAPGERIVVDWLRHDGLLAVAVERITSDPADHGRRCAQNSFHAEVMREYHDRCESRGEGECTICQGLGLFDRQPEA